ncbi:Ceramidase [Trinorchestia longiramus]|nr:Ceramidase [Trinorchestia longiramus]
MIVQSVTKKWLAAQSSPVDWCEENYTVSNNIAEFTNTFSNILFFLIPVFSLRHQVWNNYFTRVSYGSLILHGIIIVIGAASVYFHATLSLFGQMLDEVAIIWALSLGYAFLLPHNTRPKFFHGFQAVAIAVTIAAILSILWSVAPQINAFALMVFGLPLLFLKIQVLTLYSHPILRQVTAISTFCMVAAIFCWVADKTMCGLWKSAGIPGLHNLWHLLSAISSYLTITIFSYLKAVKEQPAAKPEIRFLLANRWGIPYVHCKGM